MASYRLHTLESAPAGSRPALQELLKTFGFIPNIAAAMAESPVLVGAFLGVFQKVHSGSFGEAEIQVLLLTNAVTNACTWAVAFHTFLGLNNGLDAADVQAIRAGGLPGNPRYAALSSLVRTLIETRGQPGAAVLERFLVAGYTRAQSLEVITVVAASTITNYVGSLAQPALEAQFQQYAWTKA